MCMWGPKGRTSDDRRKAKRLNSNLILVKTLMFRRSSKFSYDVRPNFAFFNFFFFFIQKESETSNRV